MYDLNTDVLVGAGDLPKGGITIGANQFKDISVPVVFTYVATNDTDQTCEFCFVFGFILGAAALEFELRSRKKFSRSRVCFI